MFGNYITFFWLPLHFTFRSLRKDFLFLIVFYSFIFRLCRKKEQSSKERAQQTLFFQRASLLKISVWIVHRIQSTVNSHCIYFEYNYNLYTKKWFPNVFPKFQIVQKSMIHCDLQGFALYNQFSLIYIVNPLCTIIEDNFWALILTAFKTIFYITRVFSTFTPQAGVIIRIL